MQRKFKILPLVIICWLINYAGCGLFETRDPQDPETTRSIFNPPTTPEIVIDNLIYSILQKNSDNYYKCLANNFKYTPDSRALAQYGQIFANWNSNSEKFYYNNLISQTSTNASSTLFLSNKIMRLITSDSASFTADYIIVYQHNRNNIPKSAIGNLRFSIKADENSFFSVNKWEDFRRNDSDFTWSELKANFSN